MSWRGVCTSVHLVGVQHEHVVALRVVEEEVVALEVLLRRRKLPVPICNAPEPRQEEDQSSADMYYHYWACFRPMLTNQPQTHRKQLLAYSCRRSSVVCSSYAASEQYQHASEARDIPKLGA